MKDEKRFVWCSRRTSLEKKLLIGVGVLVAALLGVISFVVITAENPGVCTTPGCVAASMRVLDSVDPDVDPCTDFYRFACGRFVTKESLDAAPERTARSGAEEEMDVRIRGILEQRLHKADPWYLVVAKRFYRSCMNATARNKYGLGKMKTVFLEMGGWPLKDNFWRPQRFQNWSVATRKLRRMGIDFKLFIDLSVQQHPNKPNQHVLVLGSPSFTVADAESVPIGYMTEMTQELEIRSNRIERDQRDVKQMLLNIARIIEATAKNTNGSKICTIKQLATEIRPMNWLHYISGVLAPAVSISEYDLVVVPHKSYLQSIVGLLERTPPRTIANFMAWYTLQYTLDYLPTRFKGRLYQHAQRLSEDIPKTTLSQTCLKSTKERFSLALAAAYLKLNYDEDSKKGMMELVVNLRHRFRDKLQKIQWLDYEAKRKLNKVLSNTTFQIVDVAMLEDVIAKEGIYNNIEIHEDKYLDTVLSVDLLYTNLKYGMLRRDPTRDALWSLQDFAIGFDIDYSPKIAVFRIPAGLLHELYYATDRPNYMNYGSFGTVMAHEISHTLTAAEHPSHQGNLRDWWSSESLAKYDKHAHCIVKQHERFGIDNTMSDIRRQDEDIADSVALSTAYQAYLEWVQKNEKEQYLPGINYTPNQLFWISSAIRQCAKRTSHSLQRMIRSGSETPENLRVNGAMSNLDYFAYDFGCYSGSKMNPQEKCDIW